MGRCHPMDSDNSAVYIARKEQTMKVIDAEEFKQELSKASVWTTLSISEIVDGIAFDAIGCTECRFCKEQGGHANCGGYLYCTRQKMLVDESCFCAWGKEK